MSFREDVINVNIIASATNDDIDDYSMNHFNGISACEDDYYDNDENAVYSSANFNGYYGSNLCDSIDHVNISDYRNFKKWFCIIKNLYISDIELSPYIDFSIYCGFVISDNLSNEEIFNIWFYKTDNMIVKISDYKSDSWCSNSSKIKKGSN